MFTPLFFGAVVIYFLPLFIAYLRSHNDILAICALNLLAGWTVLGWLIALVWSLTGNTAHTTRHHETYKQDTHD